MEKLHRYFTRNNFKLTNETSKAREYEHTQSKEVLYLLPTVEIGIVLNPNTVENNKRLMSKSSRTYHSTALRQFPKRKNGGTEPIQYGYSFHFPSESELDSFLKHIDNPLLAAFKDTNHQVGGNGSRDVQVLKEAFEDVDGYAETDHYGKGKIIEDFQAKIAEYLGKEAAVFFPSGTMAQQIALRIWCDEKGLKRVAYHPLCHLEIHEEDGLKELHHIEPVLLADKTRLITLEDVVGMEQDIACLLLELPQREIGGQLPDYETLESISFYSREKGIKLHLDGARLFEILPYYQKSAAEICALFDSVYVSFYKGIGGIAGAILAGDKGFTEESKVWKRRHGGDLISLYPYVISSDYYFDKRIDKMNQYYEEAKELAGLYNECHVVSTLPLEPVSNMFHVHFDVSKEKLESILIDIYEETGIGLSSYVREVSENESYYEVSIGDQFADVAKEELRKVFQKLDERLRD
jgi:threonine aldolase